MKIRREIMVMTAKKSARGRQKYTSGYIFDFIAEKYNLKPRTIKNIFWSNCNSIPPAQNIGLQA